MRRCTKPAAMSLRGDKKRAVFARIKNIASPVSRLLLKTICLAATGRAEKKDSYAMNALSIAKFITDRARPVDAAFNITWDGETKAGEKKRRIRSRTRERVVQVSSSPRGKTGAKGAWSRRWEKKRIELGARFRARALLYLALPRSVPLRFVLSFSRVSPREQETCTLRILLVVVFLLSAVAAHCARVFRRCSAGKTVRRKKKKPYTLSRCRSSSTLRDR